jgi:predicted amidohydrolase
MSTQSLTVAAFQGKAIYEDIPQSLAVIKEAILWAGKTQVDILCFPECFLQGYILDEAKAYQASLDLFSDEFTLILESLYSEQTTIILGLIEKDRNDIFNTAVVVEDGKLTGKYRKRHIHNKERFFTGGADSPIFEKKGVKYGVNICYDSRFPESAEALVKQSAHVIFCPLNNSMPHDAAAEWKDRHIRILISKAKMSGCWIVSADVVEESAANTGYGCTSLVSPTGEVLEYLEQLKPGKFLKQISIDIN